MHKIYSRKRFNIIKINPKRIKDSTLKINIKRKFTVTFLIIIIVIQTVRIMLNYINPIYEKLSLREAKTLATIVANQQSTKIIAKYSYEDIFTIDKDNEGNITMVKSNIYTINNIISDVAELIEKELSSDSSIYNKISIPLGSFSGIHLFTGSGPKVNMRVVLLGNVDTELRSEFIAQGINQTLHRVYLQIDCNVEILSAYKNLEETIHNQVLLIENVIVGKIPSSYYNLEGINGYGDTLDLID